MILRSDGESVSSESGYDCETGPSPAVALTAVRSQTFDSTNLGFKYEWHPNGGWIVSGVSPDAADKGIQPGWKIISACGIDVADSKPPCKDCGLAELQDKEVMASGCEVEFIKVQLEYLQQAF